MSAYDNKTPFEQGYHNYWFGTWSQCPYDIGTQEKEEWEMGQKQAGIDDLDYD